MNAQTRRSLRASTLRAALVMVAFHGLLAAPAVAQRGREEAKAPAPKAQSPAVRPPAAAPPRQPAVRPPAASPPPAVRPPQAQPPRPAAPAVRPPAAAPPRQPAAPVRPPQAQPPRPSTPAVRPPAAPPRQPTVRPPQAQPPKQAPAPIRPPAAAPPKPAPQPPKAAPPPVRPPVATPPKVTPQPPKATPPTVRPPVAVPPKAQPPTVRPPVSSPPKVNPAPIPPRVTPPTVRPPQAVPPRLNPVPPRTPPSAGPGAPVPPRITPPTTRPPVAAPPRVTPPRQPGGIAPWTPPNSGGGNVGSGGGGGLTPGFEKPLPPREGPRNIRPGSFTPAVPTNVVSAGSDRFSAPRHTSSVFVGIGIGSGFHRDWYCPPPRRFTHCFDYDPCYPDPFWHGHGWRHRNHWWHCDPWGGYYVSNYHRWHRWWWYPSYTIRHYPAGTFSYISYCRGGFDWSFSFSFGSTPCFTDYSLVSYCDRPVVYATPVYASTWSAPTVTVLSPVVEAPVTPTIYASTSPSLPEPATAEELRSTSDRELGDVYMRLADPASAARVYADHLAAHPGDVEAVRAYGIALIELDRAADGVDQVAKAYAIDPTLAQRPLDAQLLGQSPRIQNVLDDATRQAARGNSSAAWLTVAVLMQADARPGPARAALDRASAAGLAEPIVEWMRSVLPASGN